MEPETDELRSEGVEASRALPRTCPRLTIRRAMVAVALLGIALGLAKFLFIDNRPLDIPAWAISSLAGHFTVYAEGYSESGFRSIRPGMTFREVEDLLGEPLKKSRFVIGHGWNGHESTDLASDAWYYSDAGTPDGYFWRREIWFDQGQVTSKVSNYWYSLF